MPGPAQPINTRSREYASLALQFSLAAVLCWVIRQDAIMGDALAKMYGTHAIGHTRMATESAVTTSGAHPFTTGDDQCLVHNGSLSNHNAVRRELIRTGLTFCTDNDSEVAAGTAPASSTPCTWNTHFAISRPIVLTSPMDGSPQCGAPSTASQADISQCNGYVRFTLPAHPVAATHALNLSAGVSNPRVSRGRSLSWRATLFR